MPRNPQAVKLAKAVTTKATVLKCDRMLTEAREAHRRALVEAVEAGVPKARLARETESSASRIIEQVKRGRAERSFN
jgi:hypothetical protein